MTSSVALGLDRRMRAAVLHGAEDVRMEDVPIPSPDRGEILARVDVASIDFTDRKVYLRGQHPMIRIPGCSVTSGRGR